MSTDTTHKALLAGEVLINPVGNEKGYWSGAPGVYYSADEKAWYMTYRVRRPRGVQPDRGGESRIARSTDLKTWETVWSVTKDRYDSASIERSALRKGPDGQWHYFTSYVHPEDGCWCVAVMQSPDIRGLDSAKRRVLFTGAKLGLEGVKDPWIYEENGVFHMILSVAVPTPKTTGDSHSTSDIFNTGECVSATALATSRDLEEWEWHGVVFQPEPGAWDCYCRRINSIIPSGGKYLAFYDGSASHADNYEEKTGLAVSDDLKSWRTITPSGPAYTSPHATGSLRYIDAQPHGQDLLLFFEFARLDGAHDLRVAKIDLAESGAMSDPARYAAAAAH